MYNIFHYSFNLCTREFHKFVNYNIITRYQKTVCHFFTSLTFLCAALKNGFAAFKCSSEL